MTETQEDKIVRVNMSTGKIDVEACPAEWKLLGGRALISRILLNECDATCDPLAEDNLLVITPGVLAGSSAPTSGRLSVGCKSPLTGGIKEANVGGEPGQDLMKLGIRALVISGAVAATERRGLLIDKNEILLVEASEHRFMWNYACCENLFE